MQLKTHFLKKTLASLVLIGGLALLPCSLQAEDGLPEQDPGDIIFTIGRPIVEREGEVMAMDCPALVQNGRTYLPLRALAESLGADIDLSEDMRAIRLTYGDQVVGVRTDSTVYTVNGQKHLMATAPYVNAQYRTMVPIRVISEGLGIRVEATYNEGGETYQVHLYKEKPQDHPEKGETR